MAVFVFLTFTVQIPAWAFASHCCSYWWHWGSVLMCVCFLFPLLDPAQCPGPFLPEILPEPSPHARPPGMCVARCDQSLTWFFGRQCRCFVVCCAGFSCCLDRFPWFLVLAVKNGWQVYTASLCWQMIEIIKIRVKFLCWSNHQSSIFIKTKAPKLNQAWPSISAYHLYGKDPILAKYPKDLLVETFCSRMT